MQTRRIGRAVMNQRNGVTPDLNPLSTMAKDGQEAAATPLAPPPSDDRERADIRVLVRPNIVALEPYHSAREKVSEGILLDANENPYPQEWDGVRLNRYPDPYQRRLRQAMAAYLGVTVENVAAGVGSDEVLDWVFKVFCSPDRDAVVTAEPTYGMYRVMAQIFGVCHHEFRLDERFDFSATRFLDWVPAEAKVLILCSPNNPTGNLLNREEILEVCRSWGKIVVVDEAYIDFADARSMVEKVTQYPNLIVMRTLSKAFGRAGLRLGFAVACPEIVAYFLKVKTPYNLSALTVEHGCRALTRLDVKREQVSRIRQERNRMASRLTQLEGVIEVFPSQANYILFRCRLAAVVVAELFCRGITVRDRSSTPGLADCIRVSIGTPEENQLFLAALERVLKERKL